MLNAKGKDIGEPSGIVIRKPENPEQESTKQARPELVARTRADAIHIWEDIFSRFYGVQIKYNVLWDDIRHTQGKEAWETAVEEFKKQNGV